MSCQQNKETITPKTWTGGGMETALFTIDGTPKRSEDRQVKVAEKVENNINFYQTNQTGNDFKDALNLHGGPNEAVNPATTNVQNVDKSNETMNGQTMTHYNIDGATMGTVTTQVLKITESNMTDEQMRQIEKQINEVLKKLEKN